MKSFVMGLLVALMVLSVVESASAIEIENVEPDSTVVIIFTPVGAPLQNRKRTLDTFPGTPDPSSYAFDFSTYFVGVRTYDPATNLYSPLINWPDSSSLRAYKVAGVWQVGF